MLHYWIYIEFHVAKEEEWTRHKNNYFIYLLAYHQQQVWAGSLVVMIEWKSLE